MPAPVLIVHQEHVAREMLLQAVQAAGYEAAGFADPLKALEAIETDSRVRVLVTRVNFGEGKLNGAALARMVRHNVRRDISVVFVGRPENEQYVHGEGEFVPHPVDPRAVVDAVGRLLTTTEREAAPCQIA
jgi:DNA-binding NtrC family response regulator